MKRSYDFGWSWSALNGHWLVALLLISLSLGLQLEFPHLWPLWFVLSVSGLICFIGGIILRTTKHLKFALLPFVDVFRSENDMVLDAGCGGGRTTLSILKVLKKGRVTAFDRFDAYYIEDGGKKQIENNLKIAGLSDRVDIVQGDLTEMPFPDSHFDSAVSTHVLDHLKDKKKKSLEEIYRTLKPGGRLLMVVWVPGWVTFSLANVFCLFLSNEKEWRKMSSETGFTLRDEGYFNGMYFAVLEK
ncbi:MAG TPA: class I SAM-dependent methyltransferase [bacterium]|nr:class I SAM-dependent methyltransferase [bacterium]